MKRILLFLFIITSGVVYGQGVSVGKGRTDLHRWFDNAGRPAPIPPGYTKINARYEWIAGYFDTALHLPGYNGVPTGNRTGSWVGDGAIAMDTTTGTIYGRFNGTWVAAGGTTPGLQDVITQDPVLTANNTIIGGGFDFKLEQNISTNKGTIANLFGDINISSTATVDLPVNAFFKLNVNGSGSIGTQNAIGVNTELNLGATGDMGVYSGYLTSLNTTAGATMFTYEGMAFQTTTNNAAIGDYYGLYWGGVTQGTGTIDNLYGIYLDTILGNPATNAYAIYTKNGKWRVGAPPSFADTTNFKPLVINTTGTAGELGVLYKATYWPGGGGGSGATVALDNLSAVAINAALLPGTSDAIALGSTTKQWSDLFLAEGGVINWDAGDATLTQAGNVVTLNSAAFTVNDKIRSLSVGGVGTGIEVEASGSANYASIDYLNDLGTRFQTGLYGSTAGNPGAAFFFQAAAVPIVMFTNSLNRLDIAGSGVITLSNLAGTGSRTVLADAAGVLSAPVSDRSVKEHVKPIGSAVGVIMRLKPVSFHYKQGWKNYGEGVQLGFIAQDVAEVLPNSAFMNTSEGKLKGMMGYNETDLIPILVAAVQELKIENDKLKARIKKLETKKK